jgi:hypothetical protein
MIDQTYIDNFNRSHGLGHMTIIVCDLLTVSGFLLIGIGILFLRPIRQMWKPHLLRGLTLVGLGILSLGLTILFL